MSASATQAAIKRKNRQLAIATCNFSQIPELNPWMKMIVVDKVNKAIKKISVLLNIT